MGKASKIQLDSGLELEYEDWGAGSRPFVLVHGFTGSRDDWREHLPALAEEGHRDVAVFRVLYLTDLRGLAQKGQERASEFGDHVRALLAALGLWGRLQASRPA